MQIWQLRRGADKRFRRGHPWVYSNELAHSPRGIAAGDPVELRDAAGQFLARGYGHPHTLIAFRALSRDPAETEPGGEAGLRARLQRAAALRTALGLGALSWRWVFGEADALPGVVLDRYRVVTDGAEADGAAQALVLQAHTAGAERMRDALLAGLEAQIDDEGVRQNGAPVWWNTAVVLRNDTSARKLEGLPDDTVQVLREAPGVNLSRAEVWLGGPLEDGPHAPPVTLRADLLGGQKTGLYLDQVANVRLAAGLLARLLRAGALGDGSALVRILDLFSYVGQWGAQLARVAAQAGRAAHVTTLDASEAALALAAENVAATGATCEPLRADAMESLDDLPAAAWDVVVLDPPAFIKGRKAIPAGRAAYAKVNAAALRRVRPGGLVVTCSCSQLLSDAEFFEVLHKASRRAGVPVRWLARGGQAPDHPVLAEFPEGLYLKCWIGVAG